MAQTTYTISLVDRVTRVAQAIQQSLRGVSNVANTVANDLNSIGLIAGGAALAGIFKLGAELESTQLKFNTLTGSVEKGTKLFNDLTDFANATPFSNQALNQNANTLLAFGAKAEDVVGTLKMLGDISAGDQERLKSLTLAFAQSQSAGKLMGQDLLQMINAGFNPLQIISEQTGQSMSYLKDQMSKGAISADMVRKAFEAATAEGGRFHGLTESMSKTMAGKWSTVMGKGKFLIAQLGLSMKDIFTPFIDGILKAIDFVERYKDVMFPLLTVLATMIGVVTGLGVAFKILNAVLMVNPITLIIMAIAGLVSAIIVAWKRSEQFRGVILGVWEVLKELYNLISGFVTPAFNLLKDVIKTVFDTGVLDEFSSKFKQQFIEDLKLYLSEIEGIARAVKLIFKGEFEAAKRAYLIGKLGGYSTIVDAYNRGKDKAKSVSITDESSLLGGAGVSGLSVGLSPEAQKLQAQGVVSGGIKTFNININQLTGVQTLSTTNMEDGSNKVGDSILRALTEALADIKNID